MKLLAHMVVRNEAERYLDACLANLRDVVDDVHVCDDDSTDDTRRLAARRGAWVTDRLSNTPTFMNHEGRFRQAAWQNLEYVFRLNEGDWILAVDADEFLVADGQSSVAEVVRLAIEQSEANGFHSVVLPIPEVWGQSSDSLPLVRTDGFWAQISGARLFRYQPGGQFKDRPMGCGSAPAYVERLPQNPFAFGLSLMHYGYAHPEDQAEKYARYSAMWESGHSSAHVESIRQTPTLTPWSGGWAEVWRGARKQAGARPTGRSCGRPDGGEEHVDAQA